MPVDYNVPAFSCCDIVLKTNDDIKKHAEQCDNKGIQQFLNTTHKPYLYGAIRNCSHKGFHRCCDNIGFNIVCCGFNMSYMHCATIYEFECRICGNVAKLCKVCNHLLDNPLSICHKECSGETYCNNCYAPYNYPCMCNYNKMAFEYAQSNSHYVRSLYFRKAQI
jgi:hypothetical protein